MGDLITVGGWRRKQILGNGSFGQLSLWEELETKKVIAVKVFKGSSSDLPARQRDYWIKEVEIMHKLDHPNVVRAVPLPEALESYLQSCVPPLSMEYCRGGDLRRVLGRSENLCGLPEKDVRNILRDICRGLIYLHNMNIVHRDLKPENIVIHLDGSDQRIYKIIDLGYAKELGQASLAQSFVGTIAYLAPELFEQHPYDYTVDYWSLGILAFEVATGIRPFSCDDRAMPDLHLIRKKKPKHIYIVRTSRSIEFLSSLPDWCRLNDVFKNDFTVWLRTMLAYDPKNRAQEKGSPSSLEWMLTVLNRPLAHVLNVNASRVITFSANSGRDELYVNTMIPTDSQFILSAEGKEIQFNDLLEHGTPRTDEASICAYLFHLNGNYNLTVTSLPHNVRSLLGNNTVSMPYATQKYLWQHLCNHVAKEFTACCGVLSAYRVLLVHIFALQSEFSAKLSGLSTTYKEVKALAETLRADQDYDQKEMQRVQHSALEELRTIQGSDSRKMVPAIKEKMRTIIAKANSFHTRVTKLRENPFGRSKPPEELEVLYNSILMLLDNLRKRSISEKSQPQSNSVMLDKFSEFTGEQTRILKEISNHIIDALQHLKEVRQTHTEVNDFIRDVEKVQTKLKMDKQNHRTAIWNVIKCLISRQSSSLSLETSSEGMNGTRDSITMVPDVEMIVRENQRYRSALDSLNATMEDEVCLMTGSVCSSQNMASFL